MINTSGYERQNKHLKSSPGEGWIFCTNSKGNGLKSLEWARKGWGDEYECQIVNDAYSDRGESMLGYKSIWRKKKEG